MENDLNVKTVLTLIIGIVSLICIFSSTAAGFGLILSIVGVALGRSAKREAPSKLADVGTGINWIGVAFCIIGFVVILISYAS